jgi:hypothetical protein
VVQPGDLAHADEQQEVGGAAPGHHAERGAATGDEGRSGRVGEEPDQPERRGVADQVDRPAGEHDVADHPGDVEAPLGLGAPGPPLQEHEERHRREAERAGDASADEVEFENSGEPGDHDDAGHHQHHAESAALDGEVVPHRIGVDRSSLFRAGHSIFSPRRLYRRALYPQAGAAGHGRNGDILLTSEEGER